MEKTTYKKYMYEWLDAAVISLIVIVFLFISVFCVVEVDGTSMNTTLADNDKLILTHIIGYVPKRNDIVVISRNYTNVEGKKASEQGTPIIKRVIAVEGETVDIRDGKVYINGDELPEPYVVKNAENEMERTNDNGMNFPQTVEKGKVFVLGDNRPVSQDSRSQSIGQVDIRYILGKASLRVLPFDKFGWIK